VSDTQASDLRSVFHPRSIAVVGASSDPRKSGAKWVTGLRTAGYSGAIYPVSTGGGTIAGLHIYRSLSEIPGEVEYVVASVPARSVVQLVDECIAKRVRFVQFFTAGFSETGSPEGERLERQMLERARRAGIRIIGPNCIGNFCPAAGIPLGPSPLGKTGTPGSVSFMSQSGGIAAKLVEYGIARKVDFANGISVGNSIDLDVSDFLEYYTGDEDTRIIGAYLEGTRDGRRLYESLRNASAAKPTVIWKGGRTPAGAAAARSHTGSLAASAAVWSAMLRQAGAIEAHNLEELTDCLLLLQQLGPIRAQNVGIVGGLADGGGGISVSGSDACNDNHLMVPPLETGTRDRLLELIGEVGSILRNPVDVSPAQFRGVATICDAVRLVASDNAIDLLMLQEDVDIMHSYLGVEETREVNLFLARLPAEMNKPLVVVLPGGSTEEQRVKVEEQLLVAGIPVFPTMARAARAVALVSRRPA
jgi:acetate---CoA ligase (ADP-forming)